MDTINLKSIKAGKTIWVVFKTVQHVYQRMQLRVFPIHCTGRVQEINGSPVIPMRRNWEVHGRLRCVHYRTVYRDGKLGEGSAFLRLLDPYSEIFGIYDTYRKAVRAAVLKCDEEAAKINNLPYDLRTWWYLDQPSLSGHEHSRYTTGKSRQERHESIMSALREITAKFEPKNQELYINHMLKENKFENIFLEDKFFNKNDDDRLDTGFYFAKGKPVPSEGFKRGELSTFIVGGGAPRGKSMLNEYMIQEAERQGIRVIRHKPRPESELEPKVVFDWTFSALERAWAEDELKLKSPVLEIDIEKLKPESEDKDEPTPPSP